MENWNNLNKVLDLKTQNEKINAEFARQMIDFASQNKKIELTKLLKSGATTNCYEDSLTPLIACIENDHLFLADYLLRSGAKVSYMPNEKQDDAFWHALKNKKHDFLSLFVALRCVVNLDVNAEPPRTALIHATIESDAKSVEILLTHRQIKSKINERDGQGNTALHYNMSKESPTNDDIEIGKMLLAAGADVNATNLEGKTPQEVAVDFSQRALLLHDKLDRTVPETPELTETIEALDFDGNETTIEVPKKPFKI